MGAKDPSKAKAGGAPRGRDAAAPRQEQATCRCNEPNSWRYMDTNEGFVRVCWICNLRVD